jgi:Leu/Phe-tRNA-protein transferase
MTKPESHPHHGNGSLLQRFQKKKHKGSNNGTKKTSAEQAELESYIPLYLRQFVVPYHGEFCYSKTYHVRLLAQIMMEGFLPIATEQVLLPKLHHQRCVITLKSPNPTLHVSKSTRKKARPFHLTVNQAFDQVVEACRQQHGSKCWLYPSLVRLFQEMHQAGTVHARMFDRRNRPTHQECPVRLYSIEVWSGTTTENDDESEPQLVAGELGYTVGSVYTSLTGFYTQNNAGSVQLAALGRLLQRLGFDTWDLGMDMVCNNCVIFCISVCCCDAVFSFLSPVHCCLFPGLQTNVGIPPNTTQRLCPTHSQCPGYQGSFGSANDNQNGGGKGDHVQLSRVD